MKYKKSLAALFLLFSCVLLILFCSYFTFRADDLLLLLLLASLILFLMQLDFRCSVKSLFFLKGKEGVYEKVLGLYTFLLGISLFMIIRFFQEELFSTGIWLCSFSLVISVWFAAVLLKLKG